MFHHSSFVNSLKNTSSCVHVQTPQGHLRFSNSSYRLSQNIISHYVQYTAFISLYHPSNNKASKQPLTSCIFLQTPKPCPASILSTCFEHSGYWKHDSILQMNPYAALSADTMAKFHFDFQSILYQEIRYIFSKSTLTTQVQCWQAKAKVASLLQWQHITMSPLSFISSYLAFNTGIPDYTKINPCTTKY